MKTMAFIAAIMLLGLSTTVFGQTQGQANTVPPQSQAQPGQFPGQVTQELVTTTATVTAIDQQDRVLTLKGPEGNTIDLKVGPDVGNFSQIKVGDQVTASYFQSAALQITPPGQAPSAGTTQAVVPSGPGQTPGRVVAEKTTVTARIMAISPDRSSVTLQGPQGKTVRITVNPANIQNVKVGDEVVATYTQAIAVSVQTA